MYKSLLGACLYLVAFSTNASVIYSYTGYNFDRFNGLINGTGEVIESLYDSSMRITGSVELGALLSPNLDLVPVTPINAIFSDGINTWDLNNTWNIRISTDESGKIVDWDIVIGHLAPPIFGVNSGFLVTQSSFDVGTLQRCADIDCNVIEVHQGENNGIPGTWSVIPIPSAVWLFSSGLIGLIGIARRKKM